MTGLMIALVETNNQSILFQIVETGYGDYWLRILGNHSAGCSSFFHRENPGSSFCPLLRPKFPSSTRKGKKIVSEQLNHDNFFKVEGICLPERLRLRLRLKHVQEP
ncbi:hypothetical protein SAY87_003057 [Trapa incisa]|uniref:Uncharacterized protein n=1 Tax=Trapa incisa TaxID=236973 RepID=A0AAN7KPU3_9MYRT|nr:hypothetical protein SAY87_003057 [Trapa incisa]